MPAELPERELAFDEPPDECEEPLEGFDEPPLLPAVVEDPEERDEPEVTEEEIGRAHV